MSLARRRGWTDVKGYVPAVFAVTAFALGVQIALVTEALRGAGYPPFGKATLAWTSGLVLAASALVHVPWLELKARLAEAWPSRDIPRRSVHLAPMDPLQEADPAEAQHARNGHEETDTELTVRVHSPLSAGPVIAPGEQLPVTVEAEPEALARELELTITVRGPDGSRTVHRRMETGTLEHRVTFERLGAFAVKVKVDHPRAQPVAKTLQGRVASYDEEIGRLFEQVKEAADRAGLDVTPSSTPREVCAELRTLEEAEPSELADLAVELEVALYGDGEVDRETYETVWTAMAGTGLLEEAPSQEVPR